MATQSCRNRRIRETQRREPFRCNVLPMIPYRLLEIDGSICPRLNSRIRKHRHVCSDEQPIVVVQKRNATTSAAFTDRVTTPTGVEGYSNRINAAACACIRSGARHALRCVVPLCSQVLYRLTVSNRREPEESSSEGGMALAFLYY